MSHTELYTLNITFIAVLHFGYDESDMLTAAERSAFISLILQQEVSDLLPQLRPAGQVTCIMLHSKKGEAHFWVPN